MNRRKNVLVTAFLIVLGFSATAQDEEAVKKIILQRDSLFWVDYNTCQTEDMRNYLTEGVEFYHDRGGPMTGIQPLLDALKNNICGNPNNKVRREAVPGTVKVHVMLNGNTIYGAVISGDHKFFQKEGANPEKWTGIAKFTHLWILDKNVWKMSRVLSYDHNPAPYQNARKETTLSSKELEAYGGTYVGPQSGEGKIEVAKQQLVLNIGGQQYPLFAESKDHFFAKGRDLVFEFARDEKGKPVKLVVKENGNVAEELKRKE
jgi:hypothetical protein